MVAGYLMAAAFLVIGAVVIVLAPRMQRVAIESTRGASHVPLVGAGARFTSTRYYIPTMRAIGLLCIALALFLVVVVTRSS